jgi:hypothetical protein
MPVIRIEIGNMPPLLGSIVRSALESQKDFILVEGLRSGQAASHDDIDVVIVSGDREKLGRIPVTSFITEDSPRIVAISADGHSASIVRVTADDRRLEAAADLSNLVRHAALDRRRAIH